MQSPLRWGRLNPVESCFVAMGNRRDRAERKVGMRVGDEEEGGGQESFNPTAPSANGAQLGFSSST